MLQGLLLGIYCTKNYGYIITQQASFFMVNVHLYNIILSQVIKYVTRSRTTWQIGALKQEYVH